MNVLLRVPRALLAGVGAFWTELIPVRGESRWEAALNEVEAEHETLEPQRMWPDPPSVTPPSGTALSRN